MTMSFSPEEQEIAATRGISSSWGRALLITEKDDGFGLLRAKLNDMAIRASTARADSTHRSRMPVSSSRDFSNYREPTNFLTFSRVDRGINPPLKHRIDTETMRRIMDNVHDLTADTMEMRMCRNQVAGVAKWKQQNLYGEKEATSSVLSMTGTAASPNLGPGCYQPETYFHGPHTGGISHGTMKFLDAMAVQQDSRFKISMKERHSCLNQSAAFKSRGKTAATTRNSATASPVRAVGDTSEHGATQFSSSMGSSPSGRFLKGDRWSNPEYRQEAYLKTTGLTLGSEYDRTFLESSRVPLNLNRRDKRFKDASWPHAYSSEVDIEVDMAHTNLATGIRLHPLKFSTAFKSTTKSGFNIPTPTSGWEIGPGSYPGAQQTTQALSIKGPGEGDLSVVFRSKLPKSIPVRQAQSEYGKLQLPTLLDKNKGFVISATGTSGVKNNFLAEWTAAKISKIYPKFRGGKYSKGKGSEKTEASTASGKK